MSWKIVLLGTALLIASPVVAAAQQMSADQKIEHILDVSEVDKIVDTAFDGLRPQLIAQLRNRSKKVTPEVAEHIANIARDELARLKPSFKKFVVTFYRKELDAQEIDALYDFYKSPVGERVARKMNTIMEGLIPQTQAFMTVHFLPQFQQRLMRDPQVRNALSP